MPGKNVSRFFRMIRQRFMVYHIVNENLKIYFLTIFLTLTLKFSLQKFLSQIVLVSRTSWDDLSELDVFYA